MPQPIFFHSGDYRVETDVYQGPLDLLLDLIEKAELDITVLSLAQVTDQFLDYVRAMKEDNPTDVSAFIVIAARLIQIKSAALLPKPPSTVTELDEDSGEALARQLILYKRFKILSDSLREREDEDFRSYIRLKAPDVGLEPSLDISGLTGETLAEIASRLFAVKKQPKHLAAVMTRPRLSIHDKIRMLIDRVRNSVTVKFSSLLHDRDRHEAVVTFLAMLELIKQNAVSIRQEENFGEIEIEKADAFDQKKDFKSEFGD